MGQLRLLLSSLDSPEGGPVRDAKRALPLGVGPDEPSEGVLGACAFWLGSCNSRP